MSASLPTFLPSTITRLFLASVSLLSLLRASPAPCLHGKNKHASIPASPRPSRPPFIPAMFHYHTSFPSLHIPACIHASFSPRKMLTLNRCHQCHQQALTTTQNPITIVCKFLQTRYPDAVLKAGSERILAHQCRSTTELIQPHRESRQRSRAENGAKECKQALAVTTGPPHQRTDIPRNPVMVLAVHARLGSLLHFCSSTVCDMGTMFHFDGRFGARSVGHCDLLWMTTPCVSSNFL